MSLEYATEENPRVSAMFAAASNGVWTSGGLEMIDVVASQVFSPTNFHLIFDFKSASDRLAEMTEEMSGRYNSQTTGMELNFPLEGKVFACAHRPNAWSREEPVWVRALVQWATGLEEYRVLLIDSGQTAVVHRSSLRRLVRDFAARGHPCIATGRGGRAGGCGWAVNCGLVGVRPASGASWPNDDMKTFVDTIRGFGHQFVAIKPSWKAKGEGIILVHVKIETPESRFQVPSLKDSIDGGSVEVVRQQPEVVATCLNKAIVEAGLAILDPVDGQKMLQQWARSEQDVKKTLYCSHRQRYRTAFGKKKILQFSAFRA